MISEQLLITFFSQVGKNCGLTTTNTTKFALYRLMNIRRNFVKKSKEQCSDWNNLDERLAASSGKLSNLQTSLKKTTTTQKAKKKQLKQEMKECRKKIRSLEGLKRGECERPYPQTSLA